MDRYIDRYGQICTDMNGYGRTIQRKSTPKKEFRGLCRVFVTETPPGTHGPEAVSPPAVAGGLGGERTGLIGGARLAGAGTRPQGARLRPTGSGQ